MSGRKARRAWMTLVTSAVLWAIYYGYALLVNPWLVPGVLPAAEHLIANAAAAINPRQNELAQQYLASQPWALDAPVQLDLHGSCIFASQMSLGDGPDSALREDDAGESLTLSPFAMIWFPQDAKPGQRPISIVCESAYLKFDTKLDWAALNIGRPVRAALSGGVRIEGPDGLLIEGEAFAFDEEPMHIRCDHRVTFAYGASRGTAERLEIELISDENARRKRQFDIVGISKILLRNNVKMDLEVDDEDDEGESNERTKRQVKIQCGGRFEFEPPTNTARFEEDVYVYRPTGADEFDSLQYVDSLTLLLESEESGHTQVPAGNKGTGGMKPRQLYAKGRQMTLRSQRSRFTAKVNELMYDVPAKVARLKSQRSVEADLDSTHISCPEIQVSLGEHGRVNAAQCLGAGSLRNLGTPNAKGRKSDPFTVKWGNKLMLQPDPQARCDLLQIEEQALVHFQEQGLGLTADLIQFWVERRPKPRNNAKKNKSRSSKEEFVPRRLIAKTRAVVISPEMDIEANEIVVGFEEAAPNGIPGGPAAEGQIQPIAGAANQKPAGKQNVDFSGALKVAADKVEASVRYTGEDAPPQILEVAARGHIAVKQQVDANQEPLQLKGDNLNLDARNGAQVVSLFGQPAEVKHGGIRIEAENLQLDRGQNLAKVVGRGFMEVPMDRTLEGDKLKAAQQLGITWHEEMRFDGLSANFFGNVESRMQDSTVTCQHMRVDLTERVAFSEGGPSPSSKGVLIRQLTCKDDVTVTSDVYEGDKVKESRRAKFAEFSYDEVSGDTMALGPGYIKAWTRSRAERPGLPPVANGQANRPLQLDTSEWEFIHVQFASRAKGNVDRNVQVFENGVNIMYGRVQHPTEEVTSNDLNVKENTGWLQARTLELTRVPQSENAESHHLFVARDDSRMQARTNRGLYTASANQISYDQLKDMFVLSGQGTDDAIIHWQRSPQGKSDNFSARRIEFNRARSEIKVDNATSLDGLPF